MSDNNKPFLTVDDLIDSLDEVNNNPITENTNKDPISGLFSSLQQMLTNNKDLFGGLLNVVQETATKMDLESIEKTNFECIEIRNFLHLMQCAEKDNNDELLLNLRQCATNLYDLLTPENYDKVKDLPETCTEIKAFRKYYLEFLYNKMYSSLESLKEEINNSDTNEYTVSDLLKLKNKIRQK